MSFEREREREREQANLSRGGVEREGENPKQAPLCQRGPMWGSNSWTGRSWPQQKSRGWHLTHCTTQVSWGGGESYWCSSPHLVVTFLTWEKALTLMRFVFSFNENPSETSNSGASVYLGHLTGDSPGKQKSYVRRCHPRFWRTPKYSQPWIELCLTPRWVWEIFTNGYFRKGNNIDG